MSENTNEILPLRIGIDVGSTTVKIAILDDKDKLLYGDYQRHRADIRSTIINVVNQAFDKITENLPLKELEEIKGVISVTKQKDEYEVKVEEETVAPKIFAKIKNCNITKYDVTEPTLNEIFIAKVGEVHE